MSLRQLRVDNFRNLNNIDIELGDRLNVFFGDNGSGKTSLLESINTLSLSRSFRTRKYKTVINHSSSSFTVFGRVQDLSGVVVSVGVQRLKTGESNIRVNQKNLSSSAELAEILPVRVINSHSFSILDGSPSERRSLLDWLMFHVEHGFLSTWKAYEKCIKQRNSLLRHDKIDPLMLDTWDSELVPLAESLNEYRLQSFQLLEKEFQLLISDVDELPHAVELGFQRGWDKSLPFEEYLKSQRIRDAELGYTRQGPHRADIRVSVGGNLASDVLSRGQQKIVVCALLLAQGRVFSRESHRQCTYLIDDLPSELDQLFREQLCRWLDVLGAQVFVTSVSAEEVISAWPNEEKKVFHVKHGTISELK